MIAAYSIVAALFSRNRLLRVLTICATLRPKCGDPEPCRTTVGHDITLTMDDSQKNHVHGYFAIVRILKIIESGSLSRDYCFPFIVAFAVCG